MEGDEQVVQVAGIGEQAGIGEITGLAGFTGFAGIMRGVVAGDPIADGRIADGLAIGTRFCAVLHQQLRVAVPRAAVRSIATHRAVVHYAAHRTHDDGDIPTFHVMHHRIAHEIADQQREHRLVCPHPHRPVDVGAHIQSTSLDRIPRDVQRVFRRIPERRFRRLRVAVMQRHVLHARQRQQPLHQIGGVPVGVERTPHRGRHIIGEAALTQRRVQTGLDHRDRCAQLVRRVRDELPLHGRRALDTFQHGVHVPSQVGHLVGPRQRHAPTRFGRVEPLHLRPQRRDASGQPPRDEPRHDHGQYGERGEQRQREPHGALHQGLAHVRIADLHDRAGRHRPAAYRVIGVIAAGGRYIELAVLGCRQRGALCHLIQPVG
nr:hypothetical protein [Bifidobacterium reuteri]